MRIIAKSSLSENHIRSKLNSCRNIEIQLLEEADNDISFDFVFDIIKRVNEDANIRAIHSPICERKAVNLNEIMNPIVYRRLIYTLELAGKVSELQDHSVLAILHTTETLEFFKNNDFIMQYVLYTLGDYMTRFKNLHIGVENVIPIDTDKKRLICYKNGTMFDNVDLVCAMREALPAVKDRIGTVLDTCHYGVSLKVNSLIFANTDYGLVQEDDYYIKNKPVIKEIHLANFHNLGITNKDHGILFSDNERDKMKDKILLYKKYDYDCDICIEIKESDYLVSSNFKHNCKMLQDICEELNIAYELD